MWLPRDGEKKGGNGPVAVAIDKDKGSQYALKWAIDHLLQRGQTVFLIHVLVKQGTSSTSSSPAPSPREESGLSLSMAKELFLPFRCFCTRKDILCKDVLLESNDVAKAVVEYVSNNGIENLVVGAPSKSGFLRRFKLVDTPLSITKAAPDFCNVFVISKGKISTMKSASRPAPEASPLRNQIPNQSTTSTTRPSPPPEPQVLQIQTDDSRGGGGGSSRPPTEWAPYNHNIDNIEAIRSPFSRGRAANGRLYGELTVTPPPRLPADSDISYVSSGRPSFDRMFQALYDSDSGSGTRLSTNSDYDYSFEAPQYTDALELSSPLESACASPSADDVEAEMRRLRLELKQTIEMYSNACKEALTATQKAKELQRWKLEEQRKVEEARLAEEAALAIAAKEKAKSKAAMEAAEAAQRIADLEAQKRINAEMKAVREAEEKKKVLDALANADLRYRKYTIEEIEIATDYFSPSLKIGEGGYGPVYKCCLDHTPVAIKVLRPDASQGRSQFLKEVEVLSCIRHPNMVLLLGACPEYGCLVYEFMANGSLEDRLFCRGNTQPLSWQLRFKIAAEIGTGLMFLHQTKPEPLVHRDLKPANILLDRNFVSKISDVGLARLVPPSVADNVTQYRMTSTAGTFCYIDPEYQQTGMLGVKSDIYSLGIIFLQIITGRPPMGLTYIVEEAIEDGTFSQLLDPTVPDWPQEETLCLAKMALMCAQLRRRDRPDLGKVVLPELNRLRALAEEQMNMY